MHTHLYPPEVVEGARQEAENTGEELPSYVTDAPVLRLGLALYYNAWFELDLERNRARLESIKRSSVFQYCRDYELSETQTEDMWYYVRAMDHEFLKWYATQIKATDDGRFKRPSS